MSTINIIALSTTSTIASITTTAVFTGADSIERVIFAAIAAVAG